MLDEVENPSFSNFNENSTVIKNSIYENEDYSPRRDSDDESLLEEGEETESIQSHSFLTYY